MKRITRLLSGVLLVVMLAMPMVASAQGGNTLSCDFEMPGAIASDAPANEWVLVLKETQTVTLTMTQTSGDLDPYLILTNFDGTVITENDDGLNIGYNAEIMQVLEGGRYTVVATRFGQETGSSSGEYTLAVACETPGAVVEPPAGAGDGVLFADDFSDMGGGWWLGEDDNGRVWESDSELHILNYTDAEFTANSEAGQLFGDFTWTVDSRMVGGALDNWHYFSFRYQDAGNHYRVGYSADGYYMGEAKIDGAQVEEWAAPTPTSAIIQGIGATNAVRIEAYGDSIRFYVNDVLLIDQVVAAQNLIPEGDISFGVASMSGADYSEVAFDNVLVTGPGGAAELPPMGALTDDFSVDTGLWWLASDERGDIYIEGGELIIRDVYDDIAFSTGPEGTFGDFVLDVDSRFVSGTDNNWHFIAFRLTDSGKSTDYYRVGYSADGYVVGAEFVGGTRTDWIEPTESSAVIMGVGATNHIRLEVTGTHVVFSVNGQVVLDTYAITELPAGEVWLSADALEASDTVVAWDNFVLATP